jgi:general secretion pathway protein D
MMCVLNEVSLLPTNGAQRHRTRSMTRFRSGIHAVSRIAFTLGLLIPTLTQTVHAQVTLNFANVDIGQVAKAIGSATETTIIVDPRVKGQLNLVSENPVSKEHCACRDSHC